MALAFTKLVRSNYDELDNIPIIHQDLTASFTKQADTYYIHTGSTTSAYTKGRMYYCDGTNLKKVVIVDELPTVNNGTLTITVNGTAHTFTANQSGNTSFSITDTDTGATSVEVTGTGNAVTAASYNASTRKLTLTKGATFLTSQDISGLMPKSGGTFTGEVKFGSTENFQGYYIKRMLGFLSAGTRYADLDSSYKDGTWHRMWRLRFPSGLNFWGKIKITLYGNYSSFNASGVMSKSVTCNFNKSNIYNNVGCYDGLGVNVEQDFRISEAIWNATASAWEILIWQKNLNGNNSPEIMLECWTTNVLNYINAFNGITAQPVELTQSTSYSAQRASSTGGTKTVEWATLPVYENPLGEEIATVAMLEDKQNKITSSNKLSSSLIDGLGAAAAKAVDTAISANSTSTNLPTSKAVEDRINAHSGIDKVGTVTSVSVKMNGASKGTVTNSGTIDLGTVITAHQDISGKLDKTTYEWNKEFAAGSNGAISLGRYNIYDTQLTFDISSTTNASMSGKLVIATQNGRICQAKVFGDATGILVSKIVIYQSAITNNRSWIEVFCNFDGWSKNKVHIYGVALESATVTNQMSSVTFTNGVPSPITNGDSKWSGTIDNDSPIFNYNSSTKTLTISL